jgi:predicted Fe-Mo cluster-binding NifX family protein
MIIAVTAQQGRMDAQVDPRFGRAAYFMIANTTTMEVYPYDNAAGAGAGNGAGTGAAQLMSEHRVEVLYTGKVGPKAADALEKAGVRVVEDTTGTVEEVLVKALQEVMVSAEGGAQQAFDVQPADPVVEGALRVAIPADTMEGLDAPRSGHFGKCAFYTLVDIADNNVVAVQSMQNGGHITGGCSVPVMLLKGWDVDTVVVAGIGGRPLMGFRDEGIEVYAGEGSTVRETVDAYLQGRIGPICQDQVCGGGPAI